MNVCGRVFVVVYYYRQKTTTLSSSEQKKLLDTHAGFYLDEEDLIEEKRKETQLVELPRKFADFAIRYFKLYINNTQRNTTTTTTSTKCLALPLPDQMLSCERCRSTFPHSFLSINFELNVCDSCRVKHTDDYKLIARTDAKSEFLLKDCDFDFREPALKFIVRKNPHRNGWGEMKLYLRLQCQQRALVVHEDEEKLEEKKEIKLLNLHKTRQKNYEKKLQSN